MSDEELRKTAKGNTYVPDVWVTHHDTDWGPHLWSANIVPWDEDYDAPITGWADNTHFVNADRIVAAEARIEALTQQLEAARADAKEAEAYAEDLEKERDHWQGVAGREGVCMTCHGPRGAPEPYGCSDCLNTGYCGEWHNQMQELREKLAKAVAFLDDLWDSGDYFAGELNDLRKELKGDIND